MFALPPHRSTGHTLIAAVALPLTLVACDTQDADEAESASSLDQANTVDRAQPPANTEAVIGDAPIPVEGATPPAERVATLGLLNKRNNVSTDIELRPGESVENGPVIVRLEACERTAPYELPRETGAFVQVDIRGRGEGQHRRVFSGWLFKESPSLNVVEHPIYDVWVKDCAMRFPGEEDEPDA